MSPLVSGLASVASLIFNATSGGTSRSTGARSLGAGADAGPSAVLSLSPQAEALAGLAGKGVLPQGGTPGHSLGVVARSSAGSAAVSGRPVSAQDFQELLGRFGADGAQKAQLTAGFDANKDGSITQDEFLQGLAKTQGAQAGSDFSQTVMQLMDRSGNADGTVADKEFAAFATAFTSAGSQRTRIV